MAGPLTVDVVGPDRKLWSGTAKSVSAPSVEGSIGVLAGHEPVLCVLRAGTISVVDEDGTRDEIAIGGGFISVDHNVITIVAEPVESE
jgi:F-type H+-transporting ATPase subunit epsilon